MARTTIPASEARARVLLENAANWSRGTATTATGETIGVVLFASTSRPGVVHLTRCDGASCSCKGAQMTRRGICAHMRAVAEEARQARAAVEPRALDRMNALFDAHLTDAF